MDTIVLGREIDSGEEFRLKIAELVTGRTAVIAKTGYGKSWTIRKVVEELLERGYPVGIIDPEGEHTSLADVFDMLIISPDGDVDLTRASPSRLAQVAVKGVSFILDMSKYKPDTSTKLAAGIIEGLMKIGSPDGFLVVVDEAKELAPEKGAGSTLGKGAMSTLTWLNTLATRGRKKGIGLMFSTQRPQLVSKTLLSQAENKIILRVEYIRDLSAVIQYLGLSKDVASRISSLERGVAYVEGPFTFKPGFVKVGGVKSAHLGSTPNPKPRPPPSLQEVVRFLSIQTEINVSKTEDAGRKLKDEVVEGGIEGENGRGKSEKRRVVRKTSKSRVKAKERGTKSISVRSPEIWSLPPARLRSDVVKGLVERRNEMRDLLSTLESRKEVMDEAVYQMLKEEYERELGLLEEDLDPYRTEAMEASLVLEAAIEDRRNIMEALSSRRVNPLKRIAVKWRIWRLQREIKGLEKRLKMVRRILKELE
ncbi:MAG: DUF87 domain-containing protein [Candidatus Korarchaeota archaeon]|nr:DUF87 domain-containing protein [Candidatus Korarchaeota archaeon]